MPIKTKTVQTPTTKKPEQTPVSTKTANLIRELTDMLQVEFGSDFAYSIMARGHKVAARNLKDGKIDPIAT